VNLRLPSRFAALLIAFALVVLTFTVSSALAAPPAPEHWVGTWGTSPFAANNGRPATLVGAPPVAAPPAGATAPVPAATQTPAPAAPAATPAPAGSAAGANPARRFTPPPIYGSSDMTLREIVHVSLGGSQIRVVFTNEFGTEPLTIGAAQVAISQGGNTVNTVAASRAGLTFGGRSGITIPPGALAVSDPATISLPAEADLAVSFFLPEQKIPQLSQHGSADQTSYVADGNVVGAQAFDTPHEIRSWPFLKDVDVKAAAHSGAVVAFGDSITDGAFAANNQNARWPDELARRLLADKRTADLGVINEGIGGNRILHDNTGPSALARFDRDVIAQAGVKYVIILEAINDIGHAYDPGRAYDVVTAEDLLAGYVQMIDRAHMHGIKVYVATLTPYAGAKYMSPAGEEVRQAVNKWIRSNNQADGFIDFDKTTADPAHPDTFLPAYDHGDHLHPSDPGYKAMGDAIDLGLFTK
jgi:lysophospholipase L1-like esterase